MADFDDRAFKEFSENILQRLAIFQTACSSVSRVEAGIKLGIDGSWVSKTILKLEEELKQELNGGTLIDHSGPLAVVPTAAGEKLLELACKVRADSERFLNELTMMQRNADIRLAMTRSAWVAYGRELEAEYKAVCPEGSLNFGDEFYSRDQVWDAIEQSVLQGRADAGIYTYPPSRDKKHLVPPGLAIQPWIEEEIVLVFPGDSPRRPKASIVSLHNLPYLERIVHYRRSLSFDRTTSIEAYLKQEKVLKRYAHDWLLGVDTISEIKDTLVRMGGMSFLPWPDVKHEHERGTLQAFKLKPPMRPRSVKIAYRLHNSRPALIKFRAATAKLQGKREFHP